MAIVGIVLVIIVGVVLIGAIIIGLSVGLRSMPDLNRYKRIRRM